MILFIVPLAAWLYDQAADIASAVGDFLRGIPPYFAPKPVPLGVSYTPPFTGGQCDVRYLVNYSTYRTNLAGTESFIETGELNLEGKILGFGVVYGGATASNGYETVSWRILRSVGNFEVSRIAGGGGTGITSARGTINSVTRVDGLPDNCGNVGNPTPAPSIPDDGLFKPNNPYITDSNDVVNESAIVLLPGLPLVLVPLISSAIAAALAAARAALDALEAIKKVAEALEGLAGLWRKLKEFLDEWEKNRPKKRDITRQTYGQILGDGALDFFAPNSKTVEAIQLDIIVTSIPVGYGKYFGDLSPNRYRYRELGYVAFYSVNQGILETHSIQFKRTTLEIPKLAVGFIYHFGLDEQIQAFAFATFSIEKS